MNLFLPFFTFNQWDKKQLALRIDYHYSMIMKDPEGKKLMLTKSKTSETNWIELVKEGIPMMMIKITLDADIGVNVKDTKGRPIEDLYNTKR